MPNWCLNTVVFQGEDDRMEELRLLTEKLIERETLENKGQLYDFIALEKGYFFNTRFKDGVLVYMSRWSPNTESLIALADHLNLSYTHDYEEPGMMIYGRDIYKCGDLREVMLNDSDFDLYKFNPENELYEFEGQRYYDEDSIIQILLQRKIAVFELLAGEGS